MGQRKGRRRPSAQRIADDGSFLDGELFAEGIKLMPCLRYTIRYNVNLITRDSYSNFPNGGLNDVVFGSTNSNDFLWCIFNNNPMLTLGGEACSLTYCSANFPNPGPGPGG